jgi:hypothetical protein
MNLSYQQSKAALAEFLVKPEHLEALSRKSPMEAAAYAFEVGYFAGAIALCDAMLSDSKSSGPRVQR